MWERYVQDNRALKQDANSATTKTTDIWNTTIRNGACRTLTIGICMQNQKPPGEPVVFDFYSFVESLLYSSIYFVYMASRNALSLSESESYDLLTDSIIFLNSALLSSVEMLVNAFSA